MNRIWILVFFIFIICFLIIFSNWNQHVHIQEGMRSSSSNNMFNIPNMENIQKTIDDQVSNLNTLQQNAANASANMKVSENASENAKANDSNYADAAVQPLISTDFTINSESSFINFINQMYSNIQNQAKSTSESTDSSPITNNQRYNLSKSIVNISNMYPAFQVLINKDFNNLSLNYPNLIKNQTDVNHLLGLYFTSNAIYQYINNILPENTDLNDIGNEAKYNSQIGIYENFCTHILFFYQKIPRLNNKKTSIDDTIITTTDQDDENPNITYTIRIDPDTRFF